MRKAILAVAVGVVSLLAFAAGTPAPIPKEGGGPFVNVLSGTVKFMPLGKDRAQLSYDVMGVSTSPTGEGLLHNASMHCVGGMHVVKGAFDDESGSCVSTRPDGDQVFAIIKAAGKVGVAAKGTFTYVGGTGKMTGITGGGEFTRYAVRPAAEGTSQSVSHGTATYRLP